jgi:hypothetical protein
MAPLSYALALSLPAAESPIGGGGPLPPTKFLLNAAGSGYITNAANNGNIKSAAG